MDPPSLPGEGSSVSFLGPLPLHTLLRIVRHCRPEDEKRITAVLELVESGVALKTEFDRVLHQAGLTDRKFAVVVALYTFDPTPLSLSDLAFHIGTQRSALGATLRQLEDARWIRKVHSVQRRGATFVSLSPKGRGEAERAVLAFLAASSVLGQTLAGSEPDAISAACGTLHQLRQVASERLDQPRSPAAAPANTFP